MKKLAMTGCRWVQKMCAVMGWGWGQLLREWGQKKNCCRGWGGDGDRKINCYGNGVGMGTEICFRGGDGDKNLSPCRSLGCIQCLKYE